MRRRRLIVVVLLAAALPCAGQTVVVPGQPVVRTLDLGTSLSVGTAVSADGRSVGLNISTGLNTLDGLDTFVQRGNFGGTTFLTPAFSPPPSRSRAPAAALHHDRNYRPAQDGNVIFASDDPALLATPVPATVMRQKDFVEVAQILSAAARVNIAMGYNALRQEHADPRAKMSLDLPAGTLRQALAAVLHRLSGNTPLVVTAEENVVFITTQAADDHNVVTRSYFAEDLMGNLPRFVDPRTDVATMEIPDPIANPSVMAPVSFTSEQPMPVAAPVEKKRGPSSLPELITDAIRPEIWKNHGGKIASISQVNDKVMITAPRSVHALLAGPSHHRDHPPMYIGVGG